MSELEKLKQTVTGNIEELNQLLVEVSRRLETELRAHESTQTPPGRIVHALFRKAVRTAEAIEYLKREGLVEEAWILLRVLLETHVNFFYFIRNEPEVMTRRYHEWTLLDKLKHLREVDFYKGSPMGAQIDQASYEKQQQEIKASYSSDEFRALKQNGFTGCSFEIRAKAVDLSAMYTYCYRIASRNIHAFDPADTLVYGNILTDSFLGELIDARRITLESFRNMLLGRFAYMISALIGEPEPFRELLTLIGVGYEKFRDEHDIGIGSDQPFRKGPSGDDEEIYIWRV